MQRRERAFLMILDKGLDHLSFYWFEVSIYVLKPGVRLLRRLAQKFPNSIKCTFEIR